jgi:hypothetical protein
MRDEASMSKLTTPREPSIHREARDSGRPPGRLILVSAITPTDAGEGKTTTSIGLARAYARGGKRGAAIHSGSSLPRSWPPGATPRQPGLGLRQYLVRREREVYV